jgi:3-oxoacid CoA-transferase subunit A
MAGRLFVRGDTHGNFDFLPYFCDEHQTDKEDILIILGDAGILYYGATKSKERYLKEYISKHPITIVCVRGNHEDRPKNRENMFDCTICNNVMSGTFTYESGYPHILYAWDGGEYWFCGKHCLVVGGAYSVDKWYRLICGYKWFADEELTDQEMDIILQETSEHKYDHVFTHTCPFEWMPTDLFLSYIDQDTVSNRMERFLTELQYNCHWGEWWFGHFHADRMDVCGDGKVHMLFNQVEEIV